MSVSVVLLAHNEAATIVGEIRAFHDAVIRHLEGSELIVAEDGSRDGTYERIVEASHEVPLRIVGAPERLGYARAVVGAVAEATRPWVFLCDGGVKHDPRDFWRLWAFRERYDLIVGLRSNREDQRYRHVLTWAYNLMLRATFGVDVFDADSGMRLMSRGVAERIVPRVTFRGFSSSEIVLRAIAAGYRYAEVPVSYRQRAGESRGLPSAAIPRAVAAVLRDLIRLRREIGS